MEKNSSLEFCGKDDGDFCATYEKPPIWIFGIRAFVSIVIISENVVLLTAILKNWKTLMRQHNLYRYVLSLVSADFLNGFLLLLHALFWIIFSLAADSKTLSNESFQEVLRNLITGALYGLEFASLASAALLNLVLRVTSTQALARAAAIQPQSHLCLNRISWVRNPKVSIGLIGFVWTLALTFMVIPIGYHCHSDFCHCFSKDFENATDGYFMKTLKGRILEDDDPDISNCSILRTPARRSYLVALNAFIIFAWIVMLICNALTIFIKTEVRKSPIRVSGRNNLKLRHSFGVAWDSSSFFVLIITITLTLSTIPFAVFTFISETGIPYERIYFGRNTSAITVQFIEMTTYFASAVNPIIYTAMLGRLRSDVTRILENRKASSATKINEENFYSFGK